MVQQNKVRGWDPLGLVDDRCLAVDIDVEDQVAIELIRPVECVESDLDVLLAQVRMLVAGGLCHGEVSKVAVFIDVIIHAEGVDPARLQPLLGPATQVTARSFLEVTKKVLELSVAPRVFREVTAYTLHEGFLAYPGHELP